MRDALSRLLGAPLARPWRGAGLPTSYVAALLCCVPIADANSSPIIWERGDQIVQLARQDDAAAAPNDHPMTATPEEIEAVLKNLRLRYADEEPDVSPVSVFTAEEIDTLGRSIAAGLGRADPTQDVIFHVIGTRTLSRGAFARRNRVSAGRVFYRDGHLNIIFGQIQTPHRKRIIYGQTEDFYPRNYGSRTAPTQHDVVLLTGSSVRLHQGSEGVRDDWIVIDPSGAGVARASSPEPEPSVSGDAAAAAAVVAAEPAAASAARPDDHPAAGSSRDSGVGSSTATLDVEQRLEALKRLRERDLITEEAYQAKMKEILQDL